MKPEKDKKLQLTTTPFTMNFYRTNRFSKVLSLYLVFTLVFPQFFTHQVYALTGGPSQPEFNSFTPIGTSDMVDLTSGDFNYNIPVMDVGGYPLNLSYNSGITMDQEASWVGLGWNLNVGQIKRNVRGLPDDFDGSAGEDGDMVKYENNFRPNWTVGSHFGIGVSYFGLKELGVSGNIGLGVQYNNYNGFSSEPSIGVSFKIANTVNVGLGISGSVANGPTVSPSISISKKTDSEHYKSVTASLGMSINSRQALTSLNMSASLGRGGESEENSIIRSVKYDGKNHVDPSIGGVIGFNDNLLFTPSKRVGTISNNFTFSAAVGGTAFGISGQVKVTGFGSKQRIRTDEKDKDVKAFGYEYTERNEGKFDGVLDFNREKEGEFTKNTTLLPVTNYTYDTYSINGQGISGVFRPYRGQIGYLNSTTVADFGTGGNFGAEVEGGLIFAGGVDIKRTNTYSRTGLWSKGNRNYTIDNFSASGVNKPDYEKVYFRNSSELNVDRENTSNGVYSKRLAGDKPLSLGIVGSKYNRSLINTYNTKDNEELSFNSPFKRENRLLRNQTIQKITKSEAEKFNTNFYTINQYAKPNHTAGFNVIKPDGSRYIYGQAAYNKTKREATFAVGDQGDCSTGLIKYSIGDNSIGNNRGVDAFFNRVTTPPYAHSYLLTSVLSADYEDKTGDGPTDDDFGSYTKFNYPAKGYQYNWRIPYGEQMATLNRGFYSHGDDQKGNYVYGEREQLYIESIETKTHIAIFELSDRKDGYGVKGENGGQGSVTSKKIDKITLYSKKEYLEDRANAIPIKTAHFVYDYSLCKNIPNNNKSNRLTTNEQSNEGGKLTLKKVYFTYKKSHMGSYMPYEFAYGQVDTDNDGVFDVVSNPDYDVKGYDIWGNYKENKGSCEVSASEPTTSEFPYTSQESREEADKNTTSWTLTSMNLPSGGDMSIHYESDDYQYVQNQQAMQLFKVAGVGGQHLTASTSTQLLNNNTLYISSGWDNKYLYVEIPEVQKEYALDAFVSGLEEQPLFFKFLVNMTKNAHQYDFVTGYLFKDKAGKIEKIDNLSGKSYLSIPMQFVKLDGKDGDRSINPISKAGMYFGRKNMNLIVYSRGGVNKVNPNLVSIIEEMVGSIGSMLDIGKGPNKVLREKGCASQFKPQKSWIRLLNPNKRKFGGGLRVKKLQMGDNWDVMTGNEGNSLYKKFYGQVYSYDNEDGTTSGVATLEPNGSRENPLVMPFYDKKPSGADKVLAPQELNYTEKPIGESFYPSPVVTYGRVTVQNLPYENISKHATGKVVNTFYTSYDFPTITEYTELDKRNMYYDKSGTLANFLNFSVKNHVTASQGFSIQRNDMNGKTKGQWVYAENQETPISGVEYKYDIDVNGGLNNKVSTINAKGKIQQQLIGVNYDVVNDFRENYSFSATGGVNTNVAGFLAWIFPIIIPLPLPTYEQHENLLRTAVTTKVIEKHGLLKEKIAYDLGAKISTENVAWDATTGEVLVTKTVNEYDDAYYNINYPAYWKYEGMATASTNLGVEGSLVPSSNDQYFTSSELAYLQEGDELLVKYRIPKGFWGHKETKYDKFWVLSKENNKVVLMNRKGEIVNDPDCDTRLQGRLLFKILRSGFRNVQTASMSSITTKINPIVKEDRTYRTELPSFYNVNPQQAKIINASAVEYSEFWKPVNEEGNKYFTNKKVKTSPSGETAGVETEVYDAYNINPYVYNIKGEWRAKRSWAYLTGRYQNSNLSTRNDGYFTSFTPFYRYSNNQWQITPEAVDKTSSTKWTFASEVTQYAPYGVELENKDALNRYSSAQYGYKYTLPTAVASNTEYKEIGFDGFEDYEANKPYTRSSHFSFNDAYGRDVSKITTDKESHTGRKSIEVKPNQRVSLIKNLVDVNPKEIKDCDKDDGGGDGGGDFNVENIRVRNFSCAKTIYFDIVGKANQEVSFIIDGDDNDVILDFITSDFNDIKGKIISVILDSEGKKKFYFSASPGGVGDFCYTENPTSIVGKSDIIVTNVNGKVLFREISKDYNCIDCNLSYDFLFPAAKRNKIYDVYNNKSCASVAHILCFDVSNIQTINTRDFTNEKKYQGLPQKVKFFEIDFNVTDVFAFDKENCSITPNLNFIYGYNNSLSVEDIEIDSIIENKKVDLPPLNQRTDLTFKAKFPVKDSGFCKIILIDNLSGMPVDLKGDRSYKARLYFEDGTIEDFVIYY